MTSKHFIFGYGTLANKRTRDKTGDTGEAVVCVLRGYRRRWSHASNRGFHATGVEPRAEAECIGMLIEVPHIELYKFDKRENGYRRIQLAPDELTLLGGKLPEGSYWLYLPMEPTQPSEASPIPQSMVDVMVHAYMEHGGDELAARFILGTIDWEHPWVNDRHQPLYPRHLDSLPHQAIDALLMEHLPEQLGARREVSMPSNPELEKAILKTLKYFDLFDFPLGAEEIMGNLYGYKKPVHIKEMKGTLKALVASGKVGELREQYVMPGRERNLETRRARKFIAEKLWARVNLYGQYLAKVPFVRMVAVCNNLAYNNANESSDIDLFIVIRSGRMWLARFIITAILQFFGVRRHGDKIVGRFCLSFFVTERNMNLGPLQIDPEDPYLAYWTKTLTPIYGQNDYDEFRAQNAEWLMDGYGLKFSEGPNIHMPHVQRDPAAKRFFEWLFGGAIGNALERLLQGTFKKKTLLSMEKLDSRANVVVTDDMLKFHNHDRRREYYDRWHDGL